MRAVPQGKPVRGVVRLRVALAWPATACGNVPGLPGGPLSRSYPRGRGRVRR
jgi:hypothetical protein